MTGFFLCALAATAFAAPDVKVKARAIAPGEILLVAVSGQKPGVAPAGRLGGEELSFFPASSAGRYLAFAAVDLETPPGTLTLTAELTGDDGAKRSWTRALKVKPKKFATRRLTVAPNFVNPPKEEEERAQRESKRLHELFAETTAQRYFGARFLSPIPGAVVSRFGERSVFNRVAKAPHTGADLSAAEGTPIKAPAAGKIVLADALFYSGNSIVIDHGWGLHTFYGHLSKISVKAGDVVGAGDVIGLVGHTGRATGPHLHWALRVGPKARVDPFSLTALDLGSVL